MILQARMMISVQIGLFTYTIARNGTTFDLSTLCLDEDLVRKLSSTDGLYHRNLESLRPISSSSAFHATFESIINSLLDPQQEDMSLTAIHSITSALREIGLHRLVSISNDFSDVAVASYDQSGRKHIINLHFPRDYPSSAPYISSPSIDIDISMLPLRRLEDIVEKIDEEIDRWNDVFSVYISFVL